MSCWPGSGWLDHTLWTPSVWPSRIISMISTRSRSPSTRWDGSRGSVSCEPDELMVWDGFFDVLSLVFCRRWPARPCAEWWWSTSNPWCRRGSPSKMRMRGEREQRGWSRRPISSSSCSGNCLLWVHTSQLQWRSSWVLQVTHSFVAPENSDLTWVCS